MAEEITLSAPQVVSRTTTAYRVDAFCLFPIRQQVLVTIVGTNGERIDFKREGPDAVTLMSQVNTSNNSTTSLHKRVMQWALSQPEAATAGVSGTVTGTPE